MRYMGRNLLAVLLGVIAFVSCSRPATMQRVANVAASPLKNRVPPPDSSKYSSVRDARDWQNPYLMVQANGIAARPISTATETPTMSPRDVVAYLEKLPTIAWPYGLVVAVQENSLRNPGEDGSIKRNSEKLVRLLEEAGIKVDLWPS
jgi:hypothetical protein